MSNRQPPRTAEGTAHQLCRLISQPQASHSVASADWPTLYALAEAQGLAPMLHYIACQYDLRTHIDVETWKALEQSARQAALEHALLVREQKRIARALADAGVRVLWLKGLSVAQMLYPEPYRRPMVDLDLLVPDLQGEIAVRVLHRLSYKIEADESEMLLAGNPAIMRKLIHHVVFSNGLQSTMMVELHYRLGSYPGMGQTVDPTPWIWEQAIAREDGSLTLSPEALLLYLCAHIALQHGDQEAALKHYLDIHLLITTRSIDWDAVIAQAVDLRWTLAAEHGLRKVSELFGTRFPDDVIDTLRQRRAPEEDVASFARLQRAGAAVVRVDDMLRRLTFRERLWLIGRLLLPTVDYMRHRYQIAAGQSVWPYYGVRWWRQARQVGQWAYHRLHNQHR